MVANDESRWTPGFLVLLLMGGFGVMGGALIAPALPALIDPFGVSDDRVGWVLSVYTLSAALALPVLGFLLDRWGRRAVGITCLLIDGSFGLLCIVAPNFTTLLVFRFFQGMGIAGLIPVAMTILRDWYPEPHSRLKSIGFLSGAISASAVVIPLLGGTLAAFDWRYPFAVYGLSVVLAALFALLVTETRSTRPAAEPLNHQLRTYLSSLKQALHIRRVQETFSHALILYFMLYTLVTFVPLYLVYAFNMSPFIAGIALAVQALLSVVVATRAVAVERRWGWPGKLQVGFALIFVALLTLPLWTMTWGVAISLLIFGAGMGIVQPSIYHEATAAPPPPLAGSVVALFNTMKYFGMTAAPLVLGMARGYLPLSSLFYVAAGICALWMLLSRGWTQRTSADRSGTLVEGSRQP